MATPRGRTRRGARRAAPSDRGPRVERDTVLEHAGRTLIEAEGTRYDQVHFDSGRVNFGIGSWTGAHIPELLLQYRALADERGLDAQLYGHFASAGPEDGRTNFDAIRRRFVESGSATVLGAAEQQALRRLGADTALGEAQDRKLALDVLRALDAVGSTRVYPFIERAAISELAAVVVVHVTHQHGQSRDLIRIVVSRHGGRTAVDELIANGVLIEDTFLREIVEEVVARVGPGLRPGVRRRYGRLFTAFASSDLVYSFGEPAIRARTTRRRRAPRGTTTEGRGRYRTRPKRQP